MQKDAFTQFPLSGAAEAAPVPTASGAPPRSRLSARVPLRILAADDVRSNRRLLQQLTSYFGYEAEIVENGAEVLTALSQHPFDLVLLDVQMPVLDGLQTAREIIRLQPDPNLRPKLVALTANALGGDREACLEAGMDDCLPKPITPKAFEPCITRLFAKEPLAQPPVPPVEPPIPLAQPQAPPVPTPPPVSESIQPSLVDFAYLNSALPGLSGPQLANVQRRMYNALVKDFETIWPRLTEACSRRDQEQLARALHALKGCFLSLGWSRIADRCSEELVRTRAQQFAEWSTLPDELQQLYAASTAEMIQHLNEIDPSATAT